MAKMLEQEGPGMDTGGKNVNAARCAKMVKLVKMIKR